MFRQTEAEIICHFTTCTKKKIDTSWNVWNAGSNENGKFVDIYVDKYKQMLDVQNNNNVSLTFKVMRIKMPKISAT